MNKVVAIVLLLIGAQVNLSALVPAAAGQAPPPWWTGGGILWPFFTDTHGLLPAGSSLRETFTPLLGIAAATCFLLAAAALIGWLVPAQWFPWLVVAGAVASVGLQVIWISGWAIVPLLVDAVLLWAVLGMHATVTMLRA
ncbi:MAG: hypothetical protein CVT66_07975 [Actinobacteria bacterium HGW-Actinobacteria-6]|jgi:hypothetical protein|nr:MAG: hypothetical protein CVT66_07975 [Actinobacteria bacterium HGW-Actinobacteria-6]